MCLSVISSCFFAQLPNLIFCDAILFYFNNFVLKSVVFLFLHM